MVDTILNLISFLEDNWYKILLLFVISFILPNIKKHIKHNYIINIIDFIISIILL